MRRNNTANPLLWAALTPPVLHLAALLAPDYGEGMTVFDLMGHFSGPLERPFAIRWMPHAPKFMLGALLTCGFSVMLYCSTRENRRPDEKHSSVKWGSPKLLDRKHRGKTPFQNTALTQNVHMSPNGKVRCHNLLQIVIGGLDASRTRFLCKPNLTQANCSFLVTNPKGETMRTVAPPLIERGYVIKASDLIDADRFNAFNPFPYLRDDKDAMKLVDSLIRNTTPKNSINNDPFQEKSEIISDTAFILYLLHKAPSKEQNLEMVICIIENGGTGENDDDFQSPLDMPFEALEEEEPDHVAVREYKTFKRATGKTAKNILLSATVRLLAFTPPQITRITSRDDVELGFMRECKQAVFAIIPDSDGTSNYLVGMFYTYAFQVLCYQAGKMHQGALPVSVRLMMDKFCSASLSGDFSKLQATMRSRDIMSTVVLQDISALKTLFEGDWEGLLGNTDTLVRLGGNEPSTHKYTSELLGKETLGTRNRSVPRGPHGSNSINYQRTGRNMS